MNLLLYNTVDSLSDPQCIHEHVCSANEISLSMQGQDRFLRCHVDHPNDRTLQQTFSKRHPKKNSRQECDNLSSIEMNGAPVRVVHAESVGG